MSHLFEVPGLVRMQLIIEKRAVLHDGVFYSAVTLMSFS